MFDVIIVNEEFFSVTKITREIKLTIEIINLDSGLKSTLNDLSVFKVFDLDLFIKMFEPTLDKQGNIKMFETYGEDIEKVIKTKERFVWTVTDGEGSKLYLQNGKWLVNRMFYIVCNNPIKLKRGEITIDY